MSGCGGGVSTTPVAPAPIPTAAVITPSATSLNFAAGAPQTLTVSEPGYSGAFTATSSNSAIATVTLASTSVSERTRDSRQTESATTATFTITPVGGGTATISISDTLGHTVTVTVVVTGATLEPQSLR
jgi:hypothetical protein